MIKVNLLRNRIQDPNATTVGISSSPGSEVRREQIVKLIVMVIFPAALIIYESQNIRALNEEQNRLSAELNKMQGEGAIKVAEAEKLKDVEAQAKELEDKLKILQLLSKLRLRHVKTLDFVQSSIPERVWLKSITFEADKIHFENGHFAFTGNTTATEDLTEFVRRLDDSAYLADVIVMKNQEIATQSKQVLRDFLFTAEVGNKN